MLSSSAPGCARSSAWAVSSLDGAGKQLTGASIQQVCSVTDQENSGEARSWAVMPSAGVTAKAGGSWRLTPLELASAISSAAAANAAATAAVVSQLEHTGCAVERVPTASMKLEGGTATVSMEMRDDSGRSNNSCSSLLQLRSEAAPRQQHQQQALLQSSANSDRWLEAEVARRGKPEMEAEPAQVGGEDTERGGFATEKAAFGSGGGGQGGGSDTTTRRGEDEVAAAAGSGQPAGRTNRTKEANRQAQARYRMRRKQCFAQLEATVASLQQQLHETRSVKEQNQLLLLENRRLWQLVRSFQAALQEQEAAGLETVRMPVAPFELVPSAAPAAGSGLVPAHVLSAPLACGRTGAGFAVPAEGSGAPSTAVLLQQVPPPAAKPSALLQHITVSAAAQPHMAADQAVQRRSPPQPAPQTPLLASSEAAAPAGRKRRRAPAPTPAGDAAPAGKAVGRRRLLKPALETPADKPAAAGTAGAAACTVLLPASWRGDAARPSTGLQRRQRAAGGGKGGRQEAGEGGEEEDLMHVAACLVGLNPSHGGTAAGAGAGCA